MQLSFFDASPVMVGEALPPFPGSFRDPQSLLAEMDHFGIGQSMFFQYAFTPEVAPRMNELTLAAAKTSQRLWPCWILETTPAFVGERLNHQAELIVQSGAKAARLFPTKGPTATAPPLREYLIGDILSGLERYRIPLFIPESMLDMDQLGLRAYDPIEEFCIAFPRLPLIILEPRYNSAPFLIPLMKRHPNLHITLTLMGLFEQLETLSAMVPVEQLIFGTGLPNFDGSIATGMLLYSPLPQTTLQAIAGGNMQRLLTHSGKEAR